MRQIGIKALKNDLSKHIRAAEAGEAVQVTDRGRVVAEIVPPRLAAARGKKSIRADQFDVDIAREATLTSDWTRDASDPVPPRRAEGDFEEAILADLERRGLLRRATARKGEPLPERFPIMSHEELMRDLDESRSDR
jgi:antitoxin (DNA-binding transcriptional repressor) of toxin-antitoxin stability system